MLVQKKFNACNSGEYHIKKDGEKDKIIRVYTEDEKLVVTVESNNNEEEKKVIELNYKGGGYNKQGLKTKALTDMLGALDAIAK